jgi:hypothetical protein
MEKAQIISAETEALIEKICPHANVTSGRRSGLAKRTREHAGSRKTGREEEREASTDSAGREEDQGAEVDGSQDRTDKGERLTKGERRDTV